MKAPEMELDPKEAAAMALAAAEVQDFYGVELPPEVRLWVNVATVLGTVYIPRAVLISARVKAERAANVTPGRVIPAPPAAPKTSPSPAQATPPARPSPATSNDPARSPVLDPAAASLHSPTQDERAGVAPQTADPLAFPDHFAPLKL